MRNEKLRRDPLKQNYSTVVGCETCKHLAKDQGKGWAQRRFELTINIRIQPHVLICE